MTRNTSTDIHLAINLQAEGEAPEWIELIPAGAKLKGRDGREWLNDRPEAIIQAFKEDQKPLAIDWEHASELKAFQGEPAPAAGWIEKLDLRDGAIWGFVAWTPRGRDQVANREYRFISPSFQFEKQSRRILRLTSVGLVSQPNLRLSALNRTDTPKETIMNLTAIYQALGLTDGADEKQILSAVNRLKEETQTALNRAENPDLELFVPRKDHDQMKERATNAEKKLSELEAEQTTKEITALVDDAVKAGKIAPASKDYHIASCRQDGGIDRFKAFIDSAPVIVQEGSEGGGKPATAPSKVLTEDQKALCRQMGISEEDFQSVDA